MLAKLSIFLYSILFVTGFCYAQDCNCRAAFRWMKSTFEENDAGFTYILSLKGQDTYNYHNERILEKISTVKSKKDCLTILQDWLHFFRKGHLYIQLAKPDTINEKSASAKRTDISAIENQFKDWPHFPIDLHEFEKYLSNKKSQDFEGIWSSSPYKIAIRLKMVTKVF